MIPRLNRLPSTRLIHSQVITVSLFTLRFTKNTLYYPRFAFVVSKRIDKRAVVRNRLKRLLREIAHTYMLEKKVSVDLLFIVKKNFIELSRGELEAIVKQALDQIKV